MVNHHEQRFWPARMRWRLRGAWMWPSFIAITLLDGLLLHLLPPVGTGVDLIPGILLATFGNLILVGVLGPWLARRTWRYRRAADPASPPKAQLEVLSDRIGTGLLVAGVFAVVAAGLAARPTVISETESTEENARVVRDLVLQSGNAELIRNLETANTIRLAEGYYRTCIARDDRRRNFCVFVDTNKEPTDVVRDSSAEPNSVYKVD
ncbi:MAG: hypothetical protein QOH58_3559 [Thermoleophilaceae bacterium]|nr:hypothetical protein [Thermoleophilaceae bacterium]